MVVEDGKACHMLQNELFASCRPGCELHVVIAIVTDLDLSMRFCSICICSQVQRISPKQNGVGTDLAPTTVNDVFCSQSLQTNFEID